MTMDLLDLMDAVTAKAVTVCLGIDPTFTDVQVGFPVSKGRCVRVMYGGEREPERFPQTESLTSKLVAQGIVVRGYWPTASTGASEQRVIEGQMAAFAKGLRTAVLSDQDLGGKAQDGLKMGLAQTDQVVIAQTEYSTIDLEIVVDYDEHTQSK